MNTHDTSHDRPEPRQASGAQTERRFARRIDCAERPRPVQRPDAIAEPAPRRDDAHP
jgi:hypothetical protein